VKRGVSLDQANSEITTFAKHFAETYPDTDKSFNTGQVEPLLSTYTPLPLRGTLLTMLGFCVGVLLIGCVNVMNMQFARATLRARELAIRSSLGATRARLIVQMLTENLVVAFIGTAIGVGLAYYCTNLLATTTRNLDNPIPFVDFVRHRRRCPGLHGRAMLLAAVIPACRGMDGFARQRRGAAEGRRAGQHQPRHAARDASLVVLRSW